MAAVAAAVVLVAVVVVVVTVAAVAAADVAIAETAETVATAATAGKHPLFLVSGFPAPKSLPTSFFPVVAVALSAAVPLRKRPRALSPLGHACATFSALTGLKQRAMNFVVPLVFAVLWREYREYPPHFPGFAVEASGNLLRKMGIQCLEPAAERKEVR